MSDEEQGKEFDFFQVACGAIAIYNATEVLILAFSTFRRYKTLYFWAICACAVGCILFAAGFLDLFFKMYLVDSNIYRPLFVLTIGWYGMVTGFALVMWSRLHLVSVPKKYIRYVGFFIIYNIIFSHFPTTVMTFGANVVKTSEWVFGYSVIEKIQMTFFCIQEVILSTMYLHYTRKLRLNRKTTALVRQTLYINLAVLCLDITMLIIEYCNLYHYQIMLKVVVYSIKLKMEFLILTILARSLGQQNGTNESSTVQGKELSPSHVHMHDNPRSGEVENVQSHSESQSAKA
jgi:hypothetical protein